MANVKTHVEAGKTRKGRKKKENWPRTVAHDNQRKRKLAPRTETSKLCKRFTYLFTFRIIRAVKRSSNIRRIFSISSSLTDTSFEESFVTKYPNASTFYSPSILSSEQSSSCYNCYDSGIVAVVTQMEKNIAVWELLNYFNRFWIQWNSTYKRVKYFCLPISVIDEIFFFVTDNHYKCRNFLPLYVCERIIFWSSVTIIHENFLGHRYWPLFVPSRITVIVEKDKKIRHK